MSSHIRFRLRAAAAAPALLAAPAAGALPPADSGAGPVSFRAPRPAVQPLPAQVPPANDAFAAAEPVPGLPFAASLSTLEATTAPDDPLCSGNAASVWYAYTPPVTVWLTATTGGSGFDTTLSAYTGTQGALLQVACNDDSGGGSQSQITFLAQAGTTYFLLAAGLTGGGALELGLDLRPPLAPIGVRTTRAAEATPAAGPGYFAWAQFPRRNGRTWTAFVQPAGEARFKVNRPRTNGYPGDVEGGRVVYQEVRRGQSNIVFYDLATRARSSPPAGVNTRRWEWHATISGDWLLFGRHHARGRVHVDLVILRNLATGESRILDRLTRRSHWSGPGQVSGNHVVWFRCTPLCRVLHHQIDTGSTTVLPNAGGRHQYEPSVTADGTVYLLNSKSGCGDAVRLLRRSPAGTVRVLTSLPRRWDSFRTHALENADGTTNVYFERVHCRTRAADVLRVVDP